MNETVEKERKKETNYNYITITIKTIPKIIHVYMRPPPFDQTYLKLMTLLSKEDGGTPNLTNWFWNQARNYVDLHWPGNPQLSLERYTQPTSSLCECGSQPYYRISFSPTGPITFLCQSCFPEFRRTHSGFSFIELNQWKEGKR